jgi:glutamyl-tRNA(Gln) amidotransferase subunit D
LLLSTGGTIASKIDYRTGAVTPVLTAEELNSSVPELAKIANVEAKRGKSIVFGIFRKYYA